MINLPDTYSLRAAILFSPHRPPQTEVWVNVCDGQISSVGAAEYEPHVDLGQCALLPGLINAHAHLEFSDLTQPLGQSGMLLPAWIGEVFAWRTATDRTPIGERIANGIRESLEGGVVAVADIVSESEGPENPPLHYLALRELIATRPAQVDPLLDLARQHVTAAQQGLRMCGLSPHAPYSVSEGVWNEAVALADRHHIPLAVHLGETREELEFLSEGSGPFAELLALRDAADFVPAGKAPRAFLERLSAAPRVLIAHGNYLTAEEIAFVAEKRTQFTVVYCPRTHAYFGHVPYPLEAMLAAGVNVAIGTDGRGSNPDLSLWRELQHVAATFPSVSGECLLRMGTQAGAEALGLANRLGTIEAGKEASLAVVRLADTSSNNPYRRLFDPASQVVATLLAGRQVAGTALRCDA